MRTCVDRGLWKRGPLRVALCGLTLALAWMWPWDHPAVATQEATDLTVIAHRDRTNVEIFLSMPGDSIRPLLGKDPAILFSDQSRVPLSDFREFGSFDLADVLFAGLRAAANGEPVTVEAMSMMVHPHELELPFETPFDGMTSIAICTADYLADRLLPENVRLYYGAFASDVAEGAPLKLTFPKTGREGLSVVVRSFADGAHLKTDRRHLEDGGVLTIDPPQRPFAAFGLAGGALAVAAVAGFGLVLTRGLVVKEQT